MLTTSLVEMNLNDENLVWMWLDHLKLQAPQEALERCMALIQAVPALEDAPELNAWLEEMLIALS